MFLTKSEIWKSQSTFAPYIYHSVLSKAGFSLETQHSPLYPLFSLPFHICIQSIYYDIFYHLISSSVAKLLFVYHSSSSILQQAFLLSQWPSQFLYLFFSSSSIILPSPTLSSTAAFLFCLSILHAPSFSMSTSQMFPVVFAHYVVESKSLRTIRRYTPHKALHYNSCHDT